MNFLAFSSEVKIPFISPPSFHKTKKRSLLRVLSFVGFSVQGFSMRGLAFMPVPAGVVLVLTGKIVNATRRVAKNPKTNNMGVTLSSFTLGYLVSNL